tara:strand:+ start:469 stop:1737 length:1269 start_codon:yes stop_codon:yes gene_type:complete
MNKSIDIGLKRFRKKFNSKIPIKDKSFLEDTFVNLTTPWFISDFIDDNNINSGAFCFGFENSILVFENGFFSRNTKELYPFEKLQFCCFEKRGRIIKNKRLLLKDFHLDSLTKELDVLPYSSSLDEPLLEKLIYYLTLDGENLAAEEDAINNELKKAKQEKERLKKEKEEKAKADAKAKAEKKKLYSNIQKLDVEVHTNISNNQNLSTKIKNEENIIANLKKEIHNLKKSIWLESVLSKLPPQGIGSVHLYNNLNQKRDLFDNVQFSNITRFLSYVENTEKSYRKLFLKSHNSYFENPNGEFYITLFSTLESLNVSYNLSKVLIEEIDNDYVKFSKVYNKLEDQGFFLNDIEKIQVQSLINISKSLIKIDNSINELSNTLVKGFNKLESALGSIDNEIQSLTVETMMVNDNLGNVEKALWDL